jgi:D-citramalate synthase
MSEAVSKTPCQRVHVMDTTLRDGEQTPGVAFTPEEKLAIARSLLCDVHVDRIEVASAGISRGEGEAVRRVTEWARHAGVADRVEVLGFCDVARSAAWMAERGAQRMNLLTKSSAAHCRGQLGMAPDEHLASIRDTVVAAATHGVTVSGAYLEDWSRGVTDSPEYVVALAETLLELGVARLFLADTVGSLSPGNVARHVGTMRRAFPGAWLEFHAHDDYGLATANCLAAVAAGANGVHTSVNGLGERAGNARLAQTVVALHDHAGVATGVEERALAAVSRLVAECSGKPVPGNAPVVGDDAFTQTAGIHADGDRKGDLYVSRLSAERFDRKRAYALGKHSGRASIEQNLDALGVSLSECDRDRLLARVVELGDGKHAVTAGDLQALVLALRT